MLRKSKKKLYVRVRDRKIYDYQKKICQIYGIRSKKKDLGKYYFMLSKYRSLSRREGEHSNPYLLARKALDRRGIVKPFSELNLEDFLKRRFVYVVSQKYNYSIREARQKITSGKVLYCGYKLKSPSTFIPLPLEKTIEVHK